MFPIYPYINLNDLNLDYILKRISVMQEELTNFVNLNTIKYANPIAWDITSQYELNTVVIDPQTGNAYISVAPVPQGVTITNTSYWTPIYNYENSVNTLREQIAAANEEASATATASRAVGELVWLNGELVEIINAMNAGDAYVENSNFEYVTVETWVNSLISALTNTVNAIDAKIGDLTTLTTTANDSIVNAINEVDSEIGDLSQLQTTIKTSVVDAINDINSIIKSTVYYNVMDYGAIGDGINDDYQAITDTINAAYTNGGGTVIFPSGTYKCNTTIECKSNVNLLSAGGATLDFSGVTVAQGAALTALIGLAVVGNPDNSNSITVSTAITPSVNSITVSDASTFSVNDLVEIYSLTERNTYKTLNDGSYLGCLATIREISGNVLTFDQRLLMGSPNDTVYIRKVNPCENVIIDGLKLVGADTANTAMHGVYARFCRNVRIINCNIYGFDYYSIGITSCYDCMVLNNIITGVYYDGNIGSIYYGVAVMNDSASIIVSGNTATRERHLFCNSAYTANDFYGYPIKITVANNIAIGMEAPGAGISFAYEHHGSGLDILFIGNQAEYCWSGFNIEGSRVTIVDNSIVNFQHCGIWISEGYTVSDINILNNSILDYNGTTPNAYDAGISIYDLGYSGSRINIRNNIIRMGANVIPAVFCDALNVSFLNVANNFIYFNSSSSGTVYAIDIKSTNAYVNVANNEIYQNANGIQLVRGIIRNNLIHGSTAYGTAINVTGSYLTEVIGNIVKASTNGIVAADDVYAVGNIIESATAATVSGTLTAVGNIPISINT